MNESLVQQLKNRHIWRVLVAYPSVTFVLLQAVEFFIKHVQCSFYSDFSIFL